MRPAVATAAEQRVLSLLPHTAVDTLHARFMLIIVTVRAFDLIIMYSSVPVVPIEEEEVHSTYYQLLGRERAGEQINPGHVRRTSNENTQGAIF